MNISKEYINKVNMEFGPETRSKMRNFYKGYRIYNTVSESGDHYTFATNKEIPNNTQELNEFLKKYIGDDYGYIKFEYYSSKNEISDNIAEIPNNILRKLYYTLKYKKLLWKNFEVIQIIDKYYKELYGTPKGFEE